MALSDVKVTVNVVGRAGVEPVWFPLFVDYDETSYTDNTASYVQNIDYTEFTSPAEFLSTLLPSSVTTELSTAELRTIKAAVKTRLIYQMVEQMWKQDDHPSKFAVVYQASGTSHGGFSEQYLKNVYPYLSRGFRQIVLCTNGAQSDTHLSGYNGVGYYMQEIEALAESEDEGYRKMVYACADDTSNYEEFYNDEGALTDYDRAVCIYHPTEPAMALAAFVGATAGKTPGSVNYRNIILNNVSAVDITEDELANISSAGMITAVERAGDVVTSYGKDASGNWYIDLLDIEDYVIERLVYETQKALNVNDIVPYNNDGIAILENAASTVMNECCTLGMVYKEDEEDYDYEVNYLGMAYVPAADVADRAYKLGTVTFTAQGAIDTVEIAVDMVV